MAVVTERQAPSAERATVRRGGSYRYTLYGLQVRSEAPLPMQPLPADDAPEPDLTFRLPGGPVPALPATPVATVRCSCPVHRGGVSAAVYAIASGALLWYDGVGVFAVAADARSVAVYPAPGVDERLLALVLVGQVATYVLRQRGRPCLHASAVVIGAGAAAFVGRHGQGKSTMAAAFLHRGQALLTDDVLPLHLHVGDVYGGPSLPIMKLWREAAAGALHLDEELPGLPIREEKKLLALDERFALAPAPVRLRAVYVLDRYDLAAGDRADIAIHELSKREGLTSLLAQTYGRELALPAEWGRLLPLYARLAVQAPVRVLRYPNGFSHQDAVYARVMTDLGAA